VRHAHLQPLHAVPRAARDQRLQARQQRLAALHAKALRARRAVVRGLRRGADGARRAPRRRGRAVGRPARALECGKRSARQRSKRSVRSSARSVASCSCAGGQALARASTARASHSCSSLHARRPRPDRAAVAASEARRACDEARKALRMGAGRPAPGPHSEVRWSSSTASVLQYAARMYSSSWCGAHQARPPGSPAVSAPPR